MSIPIRNVYFMLSYAWKHFRDAAAVPVDAIRVDAPADFLATLLARGVNHLLRRGIHREYLNHVEPSSRIRGRVVMSELVRAARRPSRHIVCEFDELSYDCSANRILATTLDRVAGISGLDSEVKREVLLSSSRMPNVTRVRLRSSDFSRVIIHRNNSFYRFLIEVCRLIHDNLLPETAPAGGHKFKDFREDEARMSALFEDFVFGFLKTALRAGSVRRPHLRWSGASGSDYDLSCLPVMRTDAVIETCDRVLIVDTKYYKDPFSRRFDVPRLHSNNLFQITTYVRSLAAERKDGKRIDGMLLYASTGDEFSFSYSIDGHRILAKSLNLDQEWQRIQRDLLNVAQGSESSGWSGPAPDGVRNVV